MVGPDGLEPSTPRLSSACSNQLSYEPEVGDWGKKPTWRVDQFGGAGEIRTRDPLLAKQVLYQLSYDPKIGRLECRKNDLFSIFTLCDQLEPRRQQVLPLTASFDHRGFNRS